MEAKTTICVYCHATISSLANYCPECGKMQGGTVYSNSIPKQVLIYFVSFFLPPFGLRYVWQYYRKGDSVSKRIAFVALILTIISIVLSFFIANQIMNSVNQSLNDLNSQLLQL